MGSEITSKEDSVASLLINERIGQLSLTLQGDIMTVTPSKAFVHALAERMTRAETMHRDRAPVLDSRAARARGHSGSKLGQLFGEFPVTACEVTLNDSRLYVRVLKVQTSFGPQCFVLPEAESFVRQFESARAKAC